MADVTISQLTTGTPNNTASIPFSQDGTTYKVSPSSILEGAGPVFISGPGPGTAFRQYNTDLNPGLEIQNRRSGDWPGTSFLNAATAANLMVGNTETGTKLMIGQYSTAYSWIQNRNAYSNSNQVLMLQPEGGTVGIGLKTLPASTLHVNGTITASGLNVPGTVLKVVQSYMREYQDISPSSGWTDIVSPIDGVGLICSITPNYTTSKIFVQACINWDGNTSAPIFRLVRNNAFLAAGNSGAGSVNNAFGGGWGFGSSYTPQCNMVQYLDSPNSVASQTYKIQATGLYNNTTLKINRSQDNQSGFTSSITLMEIAG